MNLDRDAPPEGGASTIERRSAPSSFVQGHGRAEAHGSRPGAVAVVDRCLTWAAGESAGQCGPCMFGLPALAADWRALVTGGDDTAYARVSSRVGLLPGRGACRFPDGVAGLATSALRVLSDHLLDHTSGRCAASHPFRSSHERVLTH